VVKVENVTIIKFLRHLSANSNQMLKCLGKGITVFTRDGFRYALHVWPHSYPHKKGPLGQEKLDCKKFTWCSTTFCGLLVDICEASKFRKL